VSTNQVSKLSQGQIDCLLLVDRHASSKEIAVRLGISPHTVDQRIRTALETLGVERRGEAARIVASYLGLPATPAEKKGGAKLGRSETVTVRLDPKLNYLCELAARTQRRTKSSFIEWAIADSLGSVVLPEVPGFNGSYDVTLKERASELWQVDEPDRLAALALIAPALLTHEEQLIWRYIRENGLIWRGQYNRHGEWAWSVTEESLIRDRLREHWDTFKGVALGELSEDNLPIWARKKAKVAAFDTDLDDDVPF
jgi:DNA-binding CsgD family transcriptional regulator